MSPTPIEKGQPFTEERTQQIIRDFKRDGFVLIPDVLGREEVTALREKTDSLIDDPEVVRDGYVQLVERVDRLDEPYILRHTNELDRIFSDLLVREPIISLMEAIFGPSVQQCGMNVLRNDRTKAIDEWHIDDALFFPLPDEVPRHDPRIDLPIHWLNVQMPLTDIQSIEYGPTEFVPGSHYSGRHPPQNGTPEFEGRGPVSVLCEAGDIYLHNPQCWHRGAPNRSDRVRYLLQHQYGPRWAFLRYNAYVKHPMPPHVLEGASERMLQVLDYLQFHPEERYSSGYSHPDDRQDSASGAEAN
jgi:ectoine hydroxylase-related dioxygenase (phytanoyl-CoA dioxygenase family)